MVLHGPSGSMQFLVKGTRQMLLDLMDWHILNSIIDLQISLFDVELCWVILMTVFPELGQSRKLSYIIINYLCVLIFFPANVGYILQFLIVFARLPIFIRSQSSQETKVSRISAKLNCLTGSKKAAATGTRQTKDWGQRYQYLYGKVLC